MPTRWRMPPDGSCFGSASEIGEGRCRIERVRRRAARARRAERVVLQHERTLSRTLRHGSSEKSWKMKVISFSVSGGRHVRAARRLDRGRLEDAARDAEQRRLAASRRADDRGDLALVRVQRNTFERREIAEAVRDVGKRTSMRYCAAFSMAGGMLM